MYSIQLYVINLSVTYGRFLVFHGYFVFLHQQKLTSMIEQKFCWQLKHGHSFHIYICLLSTSIHKERSLSVSRQLPQFTVEKNVLEFLNDLKFILYLKYDNFSTTWCMIHLPFLPIIYVRTHYIIQFEIHKNTSCFSGNTDAAVNRMERSDWSIEISENKLGIFGCIYNSNL
jgi:hypothetical protein